MIGYQPNNHAGLPLILFPRIVDHTDHYTLVNLPFLYPLVESPGAFWNIKNISNNLFAENNQLVMYLEDNGKGFDIETARKKGSMGLLNILSRVSNLNGTFKVEKANQWGSIATVTIMHK